MRRGPKQRERGFAATLLVVIATLLLGGVLLAGALSVSRRLDERAVNHAVFSQLQEALQHFAQVHHRLPCPANGAATTGLENPSGGATDCPTPVGPIPWATLGLPATAAQDVHGRLVSYRVYDGATGFTRAAGLTLTDCLDEDVATVIALSGTVCDAATKDNTRSDFFSGKGLTVDDRGASKTRIAYVLISHGATGYGAHLPDPAVTMTAPTAGSKEAVNASDSATYWILEPSTSVGAADVNHFDDHVSYVNVNDLAVGARIGGRPWPSAARLDAANVVSVFNIATSNKATLTSGDGVTISPSAARAVCTTNTAPQGVSPCDPWNDFWGSVGGSDHLTTSGDEHLIFDFRTKRRYLRVKMAAFAAGESARLVFFDGATQVLDVTKAACAGDHSFTINPGAPFTRVTIRAVGASSFAVSSITGCKLSDAVYCTLREAAGTACP